MSRHVDLHLHTTFSDGMDTYQELIAKAEKAGVSAMSITDHDNVDVYQYAYPVAEKAGIELIPGIEMSCSIDGADVHILGFYIDVDNGPLTEHINVQKKRRTERVHETSRLLAEVGVPLDAEEVLALAGEGTVGRPHVARVLMKHGHIKSFEEAFTKYIGQGCPAYIEGSTIEPAKVIGLIRGAGGIPVVAHAIYMRNDTLIEQFVQEGLMGIEVIHPGHLPDHVNHYAALAQRLDLLKTGGSDYHGKLHKEGAQVGALKVPYDCVESLKAAKATL